MGLSGCEELASRLAVICSKPKSVIIHDPIWQFEHLPCEIDHWHRPFLGLSPMNCPVFFEGYIIQGIHLSTAEIYLRSASLTSLLHLTVVLVIQVLRSLAQNCQAVILFLWSEVSASK